MIQFLLNDKLINTNQPPGLVMVDFVRYHQHLTGTKIGCREGDCGACTVLVGELKAGKLKYTSATSCLMPLANAEGKHIVTVEGINLKDPNAIQQALCDEGGTQCGFCTPGFVMSLAGFCLQSKASTDNSCSKQKAIAAIDGNICRCTGYKSIERAAEKVANIIKENTGDDTIDFLVSKSVLPGYFKNVKSLLESIGSKLVSTNEPSANAPLRAYPFLSGGTDLYVQQHANLVHANNNFMFDRTALKGISQQDGKCFIGAAATVTDIFESPIMIKYFPQISGHIKLVSSTPIRNMATVAGNFINASPIGDLTIFFLALNAQLVLSDDHSTRELALHDLYQGYKKLNKKPTEYIKQIWFPLPGNNTLFSFEKVSKRTHLDIASVNTALSITVENNIIVTARLSAGGVAPIPFFLVKTSELLRGKELNIATIQQLINQALAEVSPISDIRGTSTYKRLLLKQLIKAHFLTLFPYLEKEALIYV